MYVAWDHEAVAKEWIFLKNRNKRRNFSKAAIALDMSGVIIQKLGRAMPF